jgi:serine/threonine-protein kinase
VPTGHLLYARDNRVFAVPFDPEAVAVTGSPVEVIDDVYVSDTNGSAAYAVSSLGTLAYVRVATGDPERELVWIDREGRSTSAATERLRYRSVSLSPDDRHAALTIQGESLDIWTYTFDRGTMSRVTSGEKSEYDAVWSPDGKELFYVVDSPPFELFRIAVGAPDTGRPIFDEKSELDTYGVNPAPGGKFVGYHVSEMETGSNLYVRRLDGSEEGRVVRATRSNEVGLTFSPDGNWMAYTSDETGRYEVYVEPFAGPGERTQVTSGGGHTPRWAPNGEIFFRRDDEIWLIPARTGATLEFDEPTKLFSFPIAPGINDNLFVYAVTASGQRILASRVPDALRSRQIEVVTDWTSTLEGK